MRLARDESRVNNRGCSSAGSNARCSLLNCGWYDGFKGSARKRKRKGGICAVAKALPRGQTPVSNMMQRHLDGENVKDDEKTFIEPE